MTQLVEVLDFIGSQLDNRGQVDVIYLDMSKAFDKVSHCKLLMKLRDYGFGGTLLAWLESYLHDQMQRVTAFGVNSQALPVTSGVPQGSILDPMLFLLYANSLPGTVKSSHVAAFADDSKILKSIKSPTDATLLQDDLSNLASLSSSGGLMFNESKCKAQRITRRHNLVSNMYHINGVPLVVTSAERDLGVIISDKLSWNKQVCEQCAKSNRVLGFVRRNTRSIKSVSVRHVIYLMLVRSHLGYATQVWSPQSKELIGKTERIQRRATKYILNLPFLCEESYKDRLIKLDLLPVSYWHEYLDMVFFFKSVTGLVKVNPTVIPTRCVLSRATRSSSNTNVTLFVPKKCKTTTYQRSFFIRTVRIWNALADDIGLSETISLSLFKAHLLSYYKQSLCKSYDPEDPRSFKSICTSCNKARNLIRNIDCCY